MKKFFFGLFPKWSSINDVIPEGEGGGSLKRWQEVTRGRYPASTRGDVTFQTLKSSKFDIQPWIQSNYFVQGCKMKLFFDVNLGFLTENKKKFQLREGGVRPRGDVTSRKLLSQRWHRLTRGERGIKNWNFGVKSFVDDPKLV